MIIAQKYDGLEGAENPVIWVKEGTPGESRKQIGQLFSSTAQLHPFLQMVLNLFLYQVTAKEGHVTEPRRTGDTKEGNCAPRRWHRRRRQSAARDPESHPDKCSKSVDPNDSFCKSVIA